MYGSVGCVRKISTPQNHNAKETTSIPGHRGASQPQQGRKEEHRESGRVSCAHSTAQSSCVPPPRGCLPPSLCPRPHSCHQPQPPAGPATISQARVHLLWGQSGAASPLRGSRGQQEPRLCILTSPGSMGDVCCPYTTQPAPRGQEGHRRALDKESEGLSSSPPLTLTSWGPKEQSLLNPSTPPHTHTQMLCGGGVLPTVTAASPGPGTWRILVGKGGVRRVSSVNW